MKFKTTIGIGCLLAAAIGVSAASAAKNKKARPEAPVTAAGRAPLRGSGRLAARYSEMLAALRAEVVKALPTLDERKKGAFMKACQDEMAAAQAAASAKRGRNKEEVGKALKAAQEALAQAQTMAAKATTAILAEVEPFLASDQLDANLVKCTVLAEATPRGLAEFADQGKEQEALVEKLLGDDKLMKEMLVAGGARTATTARRCRFTQRSRRRARRPAKVFSNAWRWAPHWNMPCRWRSGIP